VNSRSMDPKSNRHETSNLQSLLHDIDRETSNLGCAFVVDQLHAAIEGELDASTTSFVMSHVEECGSCQLEMDRLQRDHIELLEEFVVAPQLPSSFAKKVVTAIQDADSRQRQKTRLLRRRFVVGLAAGLVLGAAIFGIALQTSMFSSGSNSSDDVAVSQPENDSTSEARVADLATKDLPVIDSVASADRGESANHSTVPVKTVAARPRVSSQPVHVPAISDARDDVRGLRAVSEALGEFDCDVNGDGVTDIRDHVSSIIAAHSSSAPAAAEIAALDCFGEHCDCIDC